MSFRGLQYIQPGAPEDHFAFRRQDVFRFRKQDVPQDRTDDPGPQSVSGRELALADYIVTVGIPPAESASWLFSCFDEPQRPSCY